MTRAWRKLLTYRVRGGHANHYTIPTLYFNPLIVNQLLKYGYEERFHSLEKHDPLGELREETESGQGE